VLSSVHGSACAPAILQDMTLALVREVSPQLTSCELSCIERERIDVAQAVRQHRAYTDALQQLGCTLQWLAGLPQHPDGVFVEDTAVVVPEVAVITRPGAASRRGETPSVAAALAPHRPVVQVREPACLEGGDVLQIGRRFYVGASARTNPAGVTQLREALAPFGYHVDAAALSGCLHLKSACTFIPPDTLLVNPAWIEPAAFGCAAVIAVDEAEPYGANTLTIGATTLVSAAYPRTRERLERAGIRTQMLEVAELHKAEAALTCMSLLLEGS
jgi:dimethylargininase